MARIKIGNWKQLSPCVYENKIGVRVHVGGVIAYKGVATSINDIYKKYHLNPDFFIEMCGGNKKRGLMLLAKMLFGDK